MADILSRLRRAPATAASPVVPQPPQSVVAVVTVAPWDKTEGDRLLAELDAFCNKVRSAPNPTWDSVRRICLDVVLEARNLDDLLDRCEWMKQIARGMPPAREWKKG